MIYYLLGVIIVITVFTLILLIVDKWINTYVEDSLVRFDKVYQANKLKAEEIKKHQVDLLSSALIELFNTNLVAVFDDIKALNDLIDEEDQHKLNELNTIKKKITSFETDIRTLVLDYVTNNEKQ